NLEGLVDNMEYINLVKWIKKFYLLQGLVTSESYIIENSKKIAISISKVPKVNSSNKSYFEMINPTTKLEENLISNNIYSATNTGTTAFFGNFEKVNSKLPVSETLLSYLKILDISYLLTQKGDMIEEDDLDDWIQNTNNELEIIELDEIISLYDILKSEQKRK